MQSLSDTVCASHANGQEAWCPGREGRGGRSLWMQAEWGWQRDLVLLFLPPCCSFSLALNARELEAQHCCKACGTQTACCAQKCIFSKKKEKDTREKCASSWVTESPDATSDRPRPNFQLQEAFLGWGLWALCHPMVCSRSGHCCRCCVTFQACSGSKFLVSAVVFSYCICSTGAGREFVTHAPSCYKMEKLFKLHFDLCGVKNWKSYFNL